MRRHQRVAAGTFTVTATGSQKPTLTETGALPGGVTFTSATDVLAGTPTSSPVPRCPRRYPDVLAGTPMSGGRFPITITATNGVTPAAIQSFTLTVLGFHITTTTLPNGTVGKAYSATLHATGGVLPYKWKKLTKPPKGIKLSKSGVLARTKVAPGTYSLQVEVFEHTKPKQASPLMTLKITIVS